jgi:site-specific recombinase XerD
MVMRTLAQDFCVYLEAELGYSPLTATSYCYDLRHFFDFAAGEGVDCTPESVTTALVRKWVVEMHHRGLSHSTVARHLYALRSFWKYLRHCGYADDDPVVAVSVPKRRPRLPKHLSAEELQSLLEASQRSPSVFCGFRNYAMMATLIFTGMRRGELISLQVGDVSLTEQTVTVRGKGGKMRVIPLVGQVVEAIRDWLEFRPDDCGHDYLFTTSHATASFPRGCSASGNRSCGAAGSSRTA